MCAEEEPMSDQSHAPKPNGAQTFSVGYGRPPVHSRFKPGQSGNPKGRRKGQRNVRTVVDGELSQRIRVREGNRTRSLTKLDGSSSRWSTPRSRATPRHGPH